MAVVSSNSYQDEEDDQTTGNASPSKNGTANLASAPVTESEAPAAPSGNAKGVSSGSSGTSVNTAQPTAPGNSAQQSGSWTNLNDYLNANQGASNNLGTRVLGTVNQAASQGTGIINSAGQNFQGDVNTGTDVYNPQLSHDALAAPSAFLQGPEYTQLVNELTGTYNGPSDWGTSTEAANATQGEQNAQQTASLGLTSQGRQQILNQTTAAPYTQGQGSLNEFLLDNNPTQLQPITAAANIGGNLQGQYQQVAQNAGNQVTAGQNTSAATGNQAKGDILGGQTALINQLTTQSQQAQANTTAQGKTVGSLLNTNSAINDSPATQTSDGVSNVIPPPQLTSAEISSLGITPQQYNQLITLNQQVLGLGAPGINFGTFYQAPNVSGLTPAAEATSSQVANFNALNQLVPGSNQQFLSGATGSPLTANGSFDYQGAVTALTAQLQAAQAAATQTQTAAAATYGGQTAAQAAATAAGGLGGLASLINIGGKLYKWINNQYTPVQPDAPSQVPDAQANQNADDATADEQNAEQNDAQPQGAGNQNLATQTTQPPAVNTGTVLAGVGTAAAGTGAAAATGLGAALPTGTVTATVLDDAGNAIGDTISGTTAGAGAAGISSDIAGGASGSITTAATADGGLAVTDAAGDTAIVSPADYAAAQNAAQNVVNSGALTNIANQSVIQQIGSVVNVLATVYAVYNLVENYQSGATGSDAMQAASVGAGIGTMIFPGIGTAIGAVIGAAVGAIASAFGGGKQDPETQILYNYDAAFNANPAIAANNTPAQNFTILTGVMDGKNNSPGHATAIEQIFGRMGETNFTTQMMAQINKAITSGAVPANSTAEELYTAVVDPWLATYTGNYGGGQTTGQIIPSDQDVKGNDFGNALVAAVTNLIGQWQNGTFTSTTPLDSGGDHLAGFVPYAGASAIQQVAPPAPAAAPKTVLTVNSHALPNQNKAVQR